MSDDLFAKYADLLNAPEREAVSSCVSSASGMVAADPATMPEEFAHSTLLALRAQQEILTLLLDEDDIHYRVKLMAKASVASAQISAQLKSDETALKSRIAAVSYYQEIKDALEACRARIGA